MAVAKNFLFLGGVVVLHGQRVFPKYSLPTPACFKNPREAWGASSNSRIGMFGPPKCFQMDEGGGLKRDVLTVYCPERRIKLLLQGSGRDGFARGIYHCRVTDGRYTGRQFLAEARGFSSTAISASGCSAFQPVFWPNPVGLFGWNGLGEDLLFVQNTSVSGEFARQ